MANNYFDFLYQNSQQEQQASNTPANDGFVNLTARADADCQVVCDGDFLFLLNANQIAKEKAPVGQHILQFVSIDHPDVSVEKIVDFPDVGKNYLVVVNELKSLIEKKEKKATEDAITTCDFISIEGERGIYTGHIKDGKPEGEGKVVFNSGSTFEGNFHNGLRQGRGVLIYENGEKYEGDFVNDLCSGHAIFTYNDGRIREEIWDKGHRISIPLQAVDLGLSVKWANINLGALFEFSTQEESCKSDNWDGHSYIMNPDGTLERFVRYDENDDAVYEKITLPSGWRLPSKDEFEELIEKCIWNASKELGYFYQVVSKINNSVLYIPAWGPIKDDPLFDIYDSRYGTGTRNGNGKIIIFEPGTLDSSSFYEGGFQFQFGIRLVKP